MNELSNPNPNPNLHLSGDINGSPPVSPGDNGGFFYSAPTSPMHRMSSSLEASGDSFEFELTTGPLVIGSMTSADELFLNGQIRPMKLSSHLQHPQDLTPFSNGSNGVRGRDLDRRRRARSMSPMRSTDWLDEEDDESRENLKREIDENLKNDETPSSGASSRSSSVGRSSKRWVFLKELLYRSKSEGRESNNSKVRNPRFWSKKDKEAKTDEIEVPSVKLGTKKVVNGGGVSRKAKGGRSAHEMHYTTNRAQAEEMRRKTYLPYRQGLLGCLGFSSKGYGAMNGFARALNPVSSR